MSAHTTQTRSAVRASLGLQWLMAGAAGLIMANLYYAQPLSALICASLHIPVNRAGLLTTVPLGAYGIGLITIVPLADRIDNRRLVLVLTALVIACAWLVSETRGPSGYLFCAALLGAAAAAVQVLVPYSTYLVPPEESPRAVGRIVSGVMLGIMAARPAASFVADATDWRSVFRYSALVLAIALLLLSAVLPARRPPIASAALSYRALLASLALIVAREPVLRLRATCHGCLFGAFASFWTALPLWLANPPLRMSQAQIAWIGFAGIAGAIAPPFAGRIAARGNGKLGARVAMLVASGAFALSVLATQATHLGTAAAGIAMAAIGVVLDFAVTSHLVFCQRAIYALAPSERSRVNAVFMAGFLMVGAASSAIAAWLFVGFGWGAVAALGAGLPLAASLLFARQSSK